MKRTLDILAWVVFIGVLAVMVGTILVLIVQMFAQLGKIPELIMMVLGFIIFFWAMGRIMRQ